MWKQDIWNFSQRSSWVCLMDTFLLPALLSSDLPFQRTSAALGVPCSCLRACNNSERFLPTSPSIRNFSMPQRYKNLKERANCTTVEQHSWKIKEALNSAKCQWLGILLRRHFQWSKYKLMKSRVPKLWSTLKKELVWVWFCKSLSKVWVVLSFLDTTPGSPATPPGTGDWPRKHQVFKCGQNRQPFFLRCV